MTRAQLSIFTSPNEDKHGFSDAMTLASARMRLEFQIDDGVTCPCCGQLAKLYRRKLNANMARSLIALYLKGGLQWQHAPTAIGRNDGDVAKLAYWGFIEEERARRPDGGRAGFWRVTQDGVEFINRHARAKSHALIYNGKLVDMDGSYITIDDALGSKFNYNELMRGV